MSLHEILVGSELIITGSNCMQLQMLLHIRATMNEVFVNWLVTEHFQPCFLGNWKTQWQARTLS